MSQAIFCNLSSKTLGRSQLNAKRPIFYYGETAVVELFFEDYLDGYADSLENLDKGGSSVSVKLGARGGTAIATQTSWSNLSTTVTPTKLFRDSNLDIAWNITPISGFFEVTLVATAILPTIVDRGVDNSDYQTVYKEELNSLVHTVLRQSSTGRIHINASDADIEERIVACFNEIVAGVANVYISDDDSGYGAGTPSSLHSYTAFSLKNSIVAPKVTVSRPSSNLFTVHCYVPEFEIENGVVYVLDDKNASDYATGTWQGLHKDHVYACKGVVTIDNMDLIPTNIVGPAGKTGTIDTTDAAFGAALGTNNEVEMWMEVLLDSKTVADGRALIKKRMS